MGPIEMEELRAVGEALRDAYNRASKSKPGTAAHRAAWAKAERATARFGEIVGQSETVKHLVYYTGKRLGFGPPEPTIDRNQKFRERVKRG